METLQSLEVKSDTSNDTDTLKAYSFDEKFVQVKSTHTRTLNFVCDNCSAYGSEVVNVGGWYDTVSFDYGKCYCNFPYGCDGQSCSPREKGDSDTTEHINYYFTDVYSSYVVKIESLEDKVIEVAVIQV